jgi:hypothetical protein
MRSLALSKTISAIVIIGLLHGSSVSGKAQQRKIPGEPLQIVDAFTGKLIPEVLLLPRYSSFKGTSTLLGEGPGCGSNHVYLAKPFVYRPGDPFMLKLPKSAGFQLLGLLLLERGDHLREFF